MTSSATKWTAGDLPDMAGRTVIVTGANSGIGRAAAKAFAGRGAAVTLAVRDAAKGEAAAAEMPGGAVDVRPLDLTSLASVRAFAADWRGDIDVLVNNAGVMATPERRTEDGFELQIGTNHLGHFALTNLLLPQVRDRVVTVSSTGHRVGEIHLDDLNWERRPYNSWRAYGQSKLANLLFMFELQRRLAEAGSPVRAVAAHPGYAATELQSRTGNPIQNGLMAIGNRILAQSGDQGAWPTEFAATEDIPGGSYVGPDGRGEMRGHPTLVSPSSAATDGDVARGLWALSEQLTGVRYAFESSAAAASAPSRTA